MIYEFGKSEVFTHSVHFEVRVDKNVLFGGVAYALYAVCPYGERIITCERDKISFITDLSPSMLSSLKVGDIIKIN